MFLNIDLNELVLGVGFYGILAIIFIETGLFFGFFLPGDSLLFAAGLLASRHYFTIEHLIVGIAIAAFLGYTLSFWFGGKLGRWLLKRQDSIWFKKKYITQAHTFYEKHGGKALVFARLVPIVRTFVPIVAGMADMSWGRYTAYNLIGAVLWASAVPLLGYYLGRSIPNAEQYILPIVGLIVLISLLPGIVHFLKRRRLSK